MAKRLLGQRSSTSLPPCAWPIPLTMRSRLFAEHGEQEWEEVIGEKLVALGGGMDAVVLDGAGNGVDVGVEHGQQGHAVFGGGEAVGLVELANVVGAVVGWEGDAGEQDPAAGVEQGGDDEVEVAAGVGDGDAAEAVVAAEFDDNDGGVEREDLLKAVDAVFAGVAADAGVDDAVAVAAGVQIMLKIVRISTAGRDAVAGSDAVSETIEDGCAWSGSGNAGTRSSVR